MDIVVLAAEMRMRLDDDLEQSLVRRPAAPGAWTQAKRLPGVDAGGRRRLDHPPISHEDAPPLTERVLYADDAQPPVPRQRPHRGLCDGRHSPAPAPHVIH